jgi:hypothetical protein
MASTIFESAAREGLVQRLHVLTPQAKARWGRLTAPAMLSHLIESCRMALGEVPIEPRKLPIRFFPLNWLIIHWLPFPKNAPSAPELLSRASGDWEADIQKLQELLRRVGQRAPDERWPTHPAFGDISGGDWGVLVYRHVDHHFQQFGI